MVVRLTAGIVALASAAVLAPAPASASRTQPTVFDAGFTLLAEGPGQRANDLREINGTGADTLRVLVPWRTVAPEPGASERPAHFDAEDPDDYAGGSSITTIDQIVRGADALGMSVMLTPTSPFPDWASHTGRSEISDPIPGEFHDFVTMLGHRYSGRYVPDSQPADRCPELLCPDPGEDLPLPRVSAWSMWNEPNLDVFLQPQFRGGRPYSPTLYRRLYLAGHAGLADSGHRSDEIDIGETATTGGRSSIDPLDFARGVLCMDRRFGPSGVCRSLQASAWAHHPYGYAVAPYRRPPNPDMINMARLGRLSKLLARAYEIGATSHRLGIAITEFGVLTLPSDIGVSPIRQVTEMAASEFLAWRNPLVDSFAQYLLRDDSPKNKLIFTSGLRYADSRRSPFAAPFR